MWQLIFQWQEQVQETQVSVTHLAYSDYLQTTIHMHIILYLWPFLGIKETWTCFTEWTFFSWDSIFQLWGKTSINNIKVDRLIALRGAYGNFGMSLPSVSLLEWKFKKNDLVLSVPISCWKNIETQLGRLWPFSENLFMKCSPFSEASKEAAQNWDWYKARPLRQLTSLLEGSHPWLCPGIWGCITNKKKGKHRIQASWQGFGDLARWTSWDSS